MSNPLTSGRLTRALTLAATFGCCLAVTGQDVGDPNGGYGPNNRPVFAFLSVADNFDLPVFEEVDQDLRDNAQFLGSPVIMLKIGIFIAGARVERTHFLSDGPVTFDPGSVPPEPGTESDPANFDGNALTIAGSFKTLAPDSTIHMMTSYPDPISQEVQTAFFNASPFLEFGLTPFPTTIEVALFIYDNQGAAGASFNDILQQVFFVSPSAPSVLKPPSTAPPPAPVPPVLTGEGDFFPHTPAAAEFGYDVDLDLLEGILDADVCLDIEIDIKPDSKKAATINVKNDNGVLPIAVMTTDDFDALLELDPDTVVAVLIGTDGEVINEVAPEQIDLEDVDNDGDDDVLYKFRVQALVNGPNAPLTTTTTILFFRGDMEDGMCVQGSGSVKVVPK